MNTESKVVSIHPSIHPSNRIMSRWCVCSVTKSYLTLCDHMDYNPPDFSVHGIFQARILEYKSGVPFPPPRDLPHSVIKPTSPSSPALAGGFFTTEPPGKPSIKWQTYTIQIKGWLHKRLQISVQWLCREEPGQYTCPPYFSLSAG